jgi:xylulose-5-phosphate/fructose-6-phosphate phosphoketolase
MHQAMAATVEHCVREIREIRKRERGSGTASRPRWPMIVLRSPKGWSAPKEVGGHKLEGSWRAHQVPLPDVKKNPETLRLLENWMRSFNPDKVFDANGRLIPEFPRLRAESGEAGHL